VRRGDFSQKSEVLSINPKTQTPEFLYYSYTTSAAAGLTQIKVSGTAFMAMNAVPETLIWVNPAAAEVVYE
jgi:hypothetical protein